MEDVKSLMAVETEKCLNSIQEILSKSTNGSGSQSQWVKVKGITVKEAEDNLEGVELAEGHIIGLYLTTQGFSAITATR